MTPKQFATTAVTFSTAAFVLGLLGPLGWEEYQRKNSLMPLSTAELKRLDECQMDMAKARFEMLKRALTREDVSDFNSLCESKSKQYKMTSSETALLQNQANTLGISYKHTN